MPRTARASAGGVLYHVIHRGNARQAVFHQDEDYLAFQKLLRDAQQLCPMRILSYCLMPNHFHLILWPRRAGELSRWMQWLLTAHVRRYHRHYRSSGHVWQGRFKAFPIQADDHLLTVWRYVERNPVRADLVKRSQEWPWSSLGTRGDSGDLPVLTASPIDRPSPWTRWVNQALTVGELMRVRSSVERGSPFGDAAWAKLTAQQLGLESSLRPRGRPRKATEK